MRNAHKILCREGRNRAYSRDLLGFHTGSELKTAQELGVEVPDAVFPGENGISGKTIITWQSFRMVVRQTAFSTKISATAVNSLGSKRARISLIFNSFVKNPAW